MKLARAMDVMLMDHDVSYLYGIVCMCVVKGKVPCANSLTCEVKSGKAAHRSV